MNPTAPRIGLVRRGYSGTGGAERYLVRFANALASAGWSPVLFGSPEWPRAEWPHAFVEVAGGGPAAFADGLESCRPRQSCDFLFSLERVWRCDAYRAGDGVHQAWLERRTAFEPAWRGWVRRLRAKHRELLSLERAVFDPSSTRCVVANARFVAAEITRFHGYPADRIRVVPNGLPEPVAGHSQPDRHEARRLLGLPAQTMLALFPGSGWDRKGLPCAIRAAERLGPEVRLVVVGRGSAGRHRSKAVTFAGPVADPGPWFAACDLLVLPTWYDPFSNACLEAAAAGLPVLTTGANGFAEVMTPGVHGEVIADPADDAAFASALRAWSDPGRREAAGPLLRALAAQFTIAENVRRTLEAIGLTGGPPGPAH